MSRQFNGTDQVIRVGDVATIDITGTALTLSAWVKPFVVPSSEWITCFAKWESAPGTPVWQYALSIHQTSSRPAGGIGTGTGSTNDFTGDTGNEIVRPMEWQHHALVKDGVAGQSLRVYYNGNETDSTASTGTIPNTAAELQFGGPGLTTAGSDVDAAETLIGLMAECGIWNVALTAAQIQELANGVLPSAVQAANLVGYWPLTGTDSPELDRSGNGNNGTVVGGAPMNTDRPRQGEKRHHTAQFPKPLLRGA